MKANIVSNARELKGASLEALNNMAQTAVEDYNKETTLFKFEDESSLLVDSFDTRTVYDTVTLDEIINKIKEANETLGIGNYMAAEDSSELIQEILSQFELIDDFETLSVVFGTGIDLIRDAEQGVY